MSIFQVGQLNLYIDVTANGYELKTRYWHEKDQKWQYRFEAHLGTIESLLSYLPHKILSLKEGLEDTKDPAVEPIEALIEKHQAAIALVEKIRAKYSGPMLAEVKKAKGQG